MGILPEINRVWVSVDNRLFFWNYLYPQEFFEYDSLSEVIMSVALTTPKAGVFVDSVKYILVVSTTIEVVILAVTISNDGALRIVPTAYTVSTDNVTVYKLVGSQSGRVFMGGHDANLYELAYDSPESNWSSLLGIESRNSHKCRKINHTTWNWKKVLLPPVVRSWIDNVDESIVDMCVDDVRHLLFCVTSANRVRVIYLGKNFEATAVLSDDFDLFTEVSTFCNNERRGYSVRESAPDAGIFSDEDSVAVAGMFVVPVTESKKVNLTIVLQNGFRVCLRLIDTSGGMTASGVSLDNTANIEAMSGLRLSIVFVRGPPPAEAISLSNPAIYSSSSAASGVKTKDIAGWLPVKDRNAVRDGVRVAPGGVYCANGIFLMSGKMSANQPDSVIGVSEDLLRRSDRPSNKYGEPPSLRENVSTIVSSTSIQASSRGGSVFAGKIYDIKESCSFIHSDRAALLRALSIISATPNPTEVKDKSIYTSKPGFINGFPNVAVPVTYSAGIVAQNSRHVEFGICSSDVKFVTRPTEVEQQAIPLSHQRQLICLSRAGVQVFRKMRPIDYLIRFLLNKKLSVADEFVGNAITNGGATGSNNEVSLFFNRYGEVRACAMCIEILCGLHDDVTLGADLAFASAVLGAGDKRVLREEAFKCLRSTKFGGEPAVNNYNQQQQSSTANKTSTDGRVAAGGNFNPNFVNSHVHHASFMVCSRVLRPVWLRTITENGKIAPIWILADSWLLTCIRTHLENLRVFLGDYFRNALQARVLSSDTNSSVVGAPGNILDQLRIDFQEQQKRETSQLQQYTTEAVTREENSIHALWRLVSRAIQALNLIDILQFIQYNLKVDVPWRDLESTSFKTLVVSATVHDKIKRMMAALIVKLNKSSDQTVANSVDHVVNRLSDECFLYFSAGDRYGFEATKLVESIEKSIEQQSKHGTQDSSYAFSKSTEAETELLTVLLLKASAYWRSLSNVRDLGLASGDQFCELSTYSNALAKFGDAGRLGIVKLCLAVASHFLSSTDGSDAFRDGLVISAHGRDDGLFASSSSRSALSMASWERWLYHTGAELSADQRRQALDSVYACLLSHIGARFDLLNRTQSGDGSSSSGSNSSSESASYKEMINSIRIMVDEVLATCTDSHLRTLLFDLLLDRSEHELLRIPPETATTNNRDLELFIQDRDADYKYQLLYRYYRTHQLFIPACEHMRRLSHSVTNLDVAIREECLSCAHAAAQDAVALNQYYNNNVGGASGASLTDLLSLISDEVVVVGKLVHILDELLLLLILLFVLV
jgi:hypothetical protein